MSFFKDLKIKYKAGNLEEYSGRTSKTKDQYWHEKIKVSSIEKIEIDTTDIAIIGYSCDEGVQRNQGRIGARKGPKSLRNKLGKLPIHYSNKQITDFGNLICVDHYLEDCQEAFSRIICKLITNNILPVGIGGGHDIAYANFNGIKNALKKESKNKIGIINFDAHFDLRPLENLANSGTPFNQILSENKNVDYFAIGIQQQSNTRKLFDIAKEKEVSYISNFECENFTASLKNKLELFIEKVDYLYVTVDLDGFSSAFAAGVSAPSSLGFSPHFVYRVLDFLFESKKVISVDIAELNPDFDIDNSTASLAAKLIDYIVLKA